MSILNRTFHPDEANQAFTTGRLLETGTYSYNPQDHHGPTLYYAAATLQKAAGHHSTATLDPTLLRCTPLLFAVLALVFGALAVRKITGRIGHGLLFALLLGTSPLFVFFATDFIQEMLLAAFTMMMLWSAVGYFHSRQSANPQLSTTNYQLPTKIKPGTWALLFGIAAGLAFATKETAILTFAAAAIAFLISSLLFKVSTSTLTPRPETRNQKPETPNSKLQTLNSKLGTPNSKLSHFILALAGFTLTSLLLYSSFASNWQGVYNAFIAAPLSYIHRAAGSAVSQGAAAHVHPWWQYLEWLFLGKAHVSQLHLGGTAPNMAAGVIPLFGCVLPLLFRRIRQKISRSLKRTGAFLTLYTILLLAFYSAIPYKTPWCALQIHIGYLAASFIGFLVFGELLSLFQNWLKGVDPSAFSRGWRPLSAKTLSTITATVAVTTVIVAEYTPQLIRLNRDPDSKDIPYNYASASPQVQDLASLIIDKITAAQGLPTTNYQLPTTNCFVAVALPPEDTWPLPFYLRSIQDKVGYWTQFGELEALAGLGRKPTVVVVPAEEGHLVQPLFPHLKNTKRFEMRPRVRVRAFW